MAKDKKGFILYADQKELFDQLPNDKAGELIKFIFAYVNDDEPTTDDLLINLAFTPIKQQLKRDLDKWENTRGERSKAGKASAEKRRLEKEKQQSSTKATNVEFVQQSSTKATVNDTVNVTVNDNVINNNNATAKAIDYVKLLSYINTSFGRQFKVINDSVRSKYKARVKEGFTNEDIKTAIDNCKNNPYHIETNFTYCTPEFFSRQTTIDKYSAILDIKQTKSTDPLVNFVNEQKEKYGYS